MAHQSRRRGRDVALAVGVGALLVAVVVSRLWVAWTTGSPDALRRVVAVVVLVLFVGVPAGYGLRGLVRGGDDGAGRPPDGDDRRCR